MKNRILCLCSSGLIICTIALSTATGAEEQKAEEKPERPDYYPWTVGVAGGTEGIFGMSGQWRFADHLAVRAGVGFTEWSKNGTSIADINYDAKVRLLGEPLTLNVFPWQKHSFFIAAGLFFNQNQLTGTASDTGTITIDGHPFPADRVGTLSMKVEQQPVNPYLGIGGNFLYFDHAHRWALGGELGAIYSGDPKVSLTRSGPPAPIIDAAVKSAQKHLKDYADQFRWMPVVTIKLSFAF